MPTGMSLIPLAIGFMPHVMSLVTHGISLMPTGTSLIPLGIGFIPHVMRSCECGHSLGANVLGSMP